MPLRALPPLVLLAFALFMGWHARALRLGGPAQPGPGFFPFWIAVGLAGVSVALLVRELRGAPAPTATWPWRRLMPATLGLFLFGPVMGALGFVPTSTVFLIALLRTMGTPRSCSTSPARPPPSLPVSTATPWPGEAGPAPPSASPPSAPSWPAPSACSASRCWRRR